MRTQEMTYMCAQWRKYKLGAIRLQIYFDLNVRKADKELQDDIKDKLLYVINLDPYINFENIERQALE